jgi:hypothetical protein
MSDSALTRGCQQGCRRLRVGESAGTSKAASGRAGRQYRRHPQGFLPAVGDHVTVTTAKDGDMATKIAIRKAKASKPSTPSAM